MAIGYWLLKDSLTRKMGLLAEGGLTAQDVRERESSLLLPITMPIYCSAMHVYAPVWDPIDVTWGSTYGLLL